VGEGVSFTAKDLSLPLFIPEDARPALGLVPVQKRLNSHFIKVPNLPSGRYRLEIDGRRIGIFSDADLSAGINLSNYPTPIWEQAERLMNLITKKNDVYFHRWREVQLYQIPNWLAGEEAESRRKAELARLDTQIAEIEKQIAEARRPAAHKYQLSRTNE